MGVAGFGLIFVIYLLFILVLLAVGGVVVGFYFRQGWDRAGSGQRLL